MHRASRVPGRGFVLVEKHYVPVELLKRMATQDVEPLSDEQLAQIAAETFRELDAEKERDAESPAR